MTAGVGLLAAFGAGAGFTAGAGFEGVGSGLTCGLGGVSIVLAEAGSDTEGSLDAIATDSEAALLSGAGLGSGFNITGSGLGTTG
ncbi:MAG TPA: hypothetical protein PLO56_01220, partial [Rhodothermales bacterium]|nr:hypothetical protein [Rhodothermales bacterium]